MVYYDCVTTVRIATEWYSHRLPPNLPGPQSHDSKLSESVDYEVRASCGSILRDGWRRPAVSQTILRRGG